MLQVSTSSTWRFLAFYGIISAKFKEVHCAECSQDHLDPHYHQIFTSNFNNNTVTNGIGIISLLWLRQ